jgi:hypothetical protein
MENNLNIYRNITDKEVLHRKKGDIFRKKRKNRKKCKEKFMFFFLEYIISQICFFSIEQITELYEFYMICR